MKIRQANPRDAEAILALHADTLRRVNVRDYTPEQIEAWIGKQSLVRVRQIIASDKATVATDKKDRVIGFAIRHGNQVTGLYVSADHLRQGIATALYTELEIAARSEGHDTLTLESSLAAVPFYKAMGFEEVKRKQWPVSERLGIEVVEMVKGI